LGSKLTDSVQRAFTILEAFSVTAPALTLQQVADGARLPKVTALRYLRTLMVLGYVLRDSDSNRYKLGPKVLHLGFTVLGAIELRKVAMPYLEELSRITDQNVSLGILDDTEVLYVERIRRRHIHEIYGVGSRISAWRTATGSSILAFLPEHELQGFLSRLLQTDAARSIGPNGAQLMKTLKTVRKDGYAVNEQYTTGRRVIAAPVLNASGIAEGAINISVYGDEVTRRELVERYLPMLLETANLISAARGYVGPLSRNMNGGKITER
jgi:IclR family transcriptional regulator, pca regulon regulatory protein